MNNLPFFVLAVAGTLAAVTACRLPTLLVQGLVPLVTATASACEYLGDEKYEAIDEGTLAHAGGRFAQMDLAVERSLALQESRLDRSSLQMFPDTRKNLAQLYSAESALCDLALHPRGSPTGYDLEQGLAHAEYQAVRARLRVTMGSNAFDAHPAAADLAFMAWPGPEVGPDEPFETTREEARMDRRTRAVVAEAERILADMRRPGSAPLPFQPSLMVPSRPAAGAAPEPVALRWSAPGKPTPRQVAPKRAPPMTARAIHLTCLICGATLEVPADQGRVVCGYCGSFLEIDRRGETVALRLFDVVARMQAGTERTAAELALVRLKNELYQCWSRWQKADAELSDRRPRTDLSLLLALPLSLTALGGIVGIFVEASQSAWEDVMVCALLATVCGSLGFLVLKTMNSARLRFETERNAAWAPYRDRIAWIEKEIARNRSVVEPGLALNDPPNTDQHWPHLRGR
jgi:hypothetical protein